MIRSTFQLKGCVGPYLERWLWSNGVNVWGAVPTGPTVALSPHLDGRLRTAIAAAGAALATRDPGRLAAMLPARERWRLYAEFADDTAFLDIETDGAHLVTAIGVLDRKGPRVFLRGRDLDQFPTAAETWKLLVTFNGLAFDVPFLERAFPGWRAPHAHVDLRILWKRLGHTGGLKRLEKALAITRPPHLSRVDGSEAVRLWARHLAGDLGALSLLAEYNLYDALNLKTLMTLGYNRMIERLRAPAQPIEVWSSSNILCEVAKELLRIKAA